MTPSEITEAIKALMEIVNSNYRGPDIFPIAQNSAFVVQEANKKSIELMNQYPVQVVISKKLNT